ncbi:hypothetical protein BST61_g10000 [Cercospora zeina]
MKLTIILLSILPTLSIAVGCPKANGGCRGTCNVAGSCKVPPSDRPSSKGGFVFPCGAGVCKIGGATCIAFGDAPTQCPN